MSGPQEPISGHKAFYFKIVDYMVSSANSPTKVASVPFEIDIEVEVSKVVLERRHI